MTGVQRVLFRSVGISLLTRRDHGVVEDLARRRVAIGGGFVDIGVEDRQSVV